MEFEETEPTINIHSL